jgi:hypothetical protein
MDYEALNRGAIVRNDKFQKKNFDNVSRSMLILFLLDGPDVKSQGLGCTVSSRTRFQVNTSDG